jgi:uncharacterized phiE125 gp8 family phage protein
MVMGTLRLVSRSTSAAVGLEDFIEHVRRGDTTEDDRLLESYLKAATSWAENFTGLALIDQTWDYWTESFPTDNKPLLLPKPPLLEVSGVFYTAGAEAQFTGFSVDYGMPARVYLPASGSWPTTDVTSNAVRVRFRAGYIDELGSPSNEGEIPEDIKIAIMMYASTMYENRETLVTGTIAQNLPWGAENLLRMYRVENSLS